MLRRQSWLGEPEEAEDPDFSLSGRRFRPVLPGLEGIARPKIGPSKSKVEGIEKKYFFIQEYTLAFKLIFFLQAAVVASLLVELLDGSVHGLNRTVPFALACAEWPLMLFWLVPDLVRRLTVRAAVTRTRKNYWFRDQQRSLVKKVMISGIEGLLRDCSRLIHLQGMEARAVMASETWTLTAKALTGQSREYLEKTQQLMAVKNVRWGTNLFNDLPPNLKTEVNSIFTSWDAQNAGAVAPVELARNIRLMGFTATANRVAQNLIRLVDDDGSGMLTFRKCAALFMLATTGRPTQERRRDLQSFFSRVRKRSPRNATVFELARALPLNSITAEDLATLMYRHFGRVKPSVTRAEFVEWIEAIESSQLLAEAAKVA